MYYKKINITNDLIKDLNLLFEYKPELINKNFAFRNSESFNVQ